MPRLLLRCFASHGFNLYYGTCKMGNWDRTVFFRLGVIVLWFSLTFSILPVNLTCKLLVTSQAPETLQLLTEHQIHRSNHGHSISKQVASRDVVKATQVCETGGTDVAAVWPLATVTDKIHSHLSLGSLDHGIRLTRWHGVTLGVKQEVVDQGLHVLLHGGTRGRGDLVVFDSYRSSGHVVQTLVDDTEGLAEFLHAAQVSVVAVTVDADWDIKFDLVICVVRLALSDIPRHTGTSKHDTGERKVESICSRHNTDTLQSVDPNTVVRQHLFSFVNTVAELGGPLVNVVEKAHGDILVNTTGADVCSVQTGTRYTFVEFLFGWLADCVVFVCHFCRLFD